MNTQQATSLLTNTANTLSQSLIKLGLENNSEIVVSLRKKVNQAVKVAFDIREQLVSKLDSLKAKALLAEDELSFAVGYQSIEQDRLADLQKQRSLQEIAIQSLQERKQVLSDTGDSKISAIKAEIAKLNANITKTEAEIASVKKRISDGLELVSSYDSLREQAQAAQDKANYHNQYVQYWGVVGRERVGRGFRDKYGWITNVAETNARDSFQAQANSLTQQAVAIQGQVASFMQSLPVLEQTEKSKTNQIWLFYQELDTKKNILSFATVQNSNALALLDLQLNDSQSDLSDLKNIAIPNQKAITDDTDQNVAQARSKLEQFNAQKLSAQNTLNSFNQNHEELLTTNLTLEILQNSITISQSKIITLHANLEKPNQSIELINSLTQALALEKSKLGQLKEQYHLGVMEAIVSNQDRLESLKSQLAAEASLESAIEETTIGGYAVLVSQFAEQLTSLSDIWVENLKNNHQFTVNISNLFVSNLTAFAGVKQFIEDNLAIPYSDYLLNKIQLDEALAIQKTQVQYRDTLAKTVDDMQENIELQKKSVEQTDLLSTKLTHIVTLRSLETQYTTLGNQASKSLRFELVDILSKENANKTQELPNQIVLSNYQQEAFIETALQKYLQNKQETVFNSQEKQLNLLRETYQQPTRALYFNGVNDYINAGIKLSLKVTTNLTLEAWINPQQDSRTRVIVGREGEYLLALSGPDNIIHYAVANSNPGWTWISTNYSVKSNQWSHVAFSFDNGQIKTYVNGELIYKFDGIGTIGDVVSQQNELRIGNRQNNNSDYFKGQIDEVRVWNVTRNQAEIQTFYNRNLNGKEQGLVGYWNFEESTGDKVNDLTVNNNQGTLINGVQRTVDNLVDVKYQPSRSLLFDGINDYVNAGLNSSLKVSTNLTLEAWIKPQAKGNNGLIVSREGEYLLSVGSDNQIYYAVANTNPRWAWIGTGYTVSVNQWTHIAFTYNNGEIKLYGNGKLAYYYQGSGAIGDVVTNQDEFRIGNRQSNNSESFKGEIDEVRVWNTTRTQAEIQANPNQKLTGKEQGLVGYWNFEESTGDKVNDLTVNNNQGTLINGVQRTVDNLVDVKYQPSRSLLFDGINDYVNAGLNSSLKVSTNLTLEAWIKPQAKGNNGLIVSREGEYLLSVGSDNQIYYAVANTNPRWTWIGTGYTVSVNQWTHIAFTYNNGEIKLYGNGKLAYYYQGSGAIGDVVTNQDEFRIGNRQSNNSEYFKGEIDEVRVWNTTRTQAEIQANPNQKLTGKEQGLVGYWNFEESTGDKVNDLTVNNNQGTLINGVQRTVDNLVDVKYQPSRSLLFDGINDYVNAGLNSSLKVSTNLTLESWIKPQAKGNNGLIVSREGEYLLSVGSDNQIYYAVANTNPRWAWIGTGYTVSVNQWTHIAFTYNNGEIKLYGNGKLAYYYQGSGAIGDVVTNQDEFRIGNRQSNNSEYFKGEIDEVRVWNTTRTQAEIQANPNQKLTGKEQGLVGYWNFEESTGDKVNDLTVNNNQGTLINGVQRTVDSSIAVPKVLDEQTNITYDKSITELQKLRLEITHLNLQAEKNPDKVQKFLQEYEASDKTISTLQTLRSKFFPELNQATILADLQNQINNEIGQTQQQIEQLKASISQKQAQSSAALSQADWYEQEAANRWQLSRKGGPTWTEERESKGSSGRSKIVTVTHVDHDWIIWDTYTKQAVSLREQATNLLKGLTTDTTNQNTANDILKQWQDASAVADQVGVTQADLTVLLDQLNADRQLNGDKKQQIADWEKSLPTLQRKLQQSIIDAQTAKANTTREWTEYHTSQDQYQTSLTDILAQRTQLQSQSQFLLQEIGNVNQWINRQNTFLNDEISQVKALVDQLNTQKTAIPSTLTTDQTLTLKALIDQSIQLLTQKQIVLTAEQSAFTQKQALLGTQKKVILTQYDLLNAYLESPDKDTTNLEKLLADTITTLAEVKKIAKQAETSSNALTVLMDDVQFSLLLQNDKYLSAIQDKQNTLQDLLNATKFNKNYTAQATQKQIELNGLQTQLFDVLKKTNDAGNKEAAKLLEVSRSNSFATVAELYHRDYQDLATDNGGRCSGGIARPEDIQLANYYYNEMLKYRQLKSEAEQQVTQFAHLRTLAESQVSAIKGQEVLAAQELADLKQSIGNSQELINAKQVELGIAQFRVDALLEMRNWTEQTQVQLLSVEQLNLAQAKLEQDTANNRQYLIDNIVKNQLDQQRLIIERDRQIAVVKLEQLKQLKTEEALQIAINNLRDDVGVNPITEVIQLANYKGQLAGVLTDIEALKQKQPNLPATTKTLLDNTIKDINAALQGKEIKNIQDNLLRSANALIEQSNILKIEVAKLQQEEQRYIDLLTQSQTDLKGATRTLYDEIQKSGILDSEKTLLNAQNLQILYKIGFAQGAIDLSSALAKQSQDILEQVINGRIEERKVREKAAFNEIFSTVTLVISAVAAVLTAGAYLAATAASAGLSGTAATAAAANATVLGVSTTTLSSIATTLNTLNTSLSIFQAAYNGDWSTVIFKTGLALVGGLKDIVGLSKETVTALKTSINTAYLSYKGGDSIGVLLSAIQGAGAVATDGIDLGDLSKVSELKTFLITASQISTVVHAGVKAIEDGDVLKGIQALGQSLGTISKNFGLGLEESAKAKLENLTGIEWQKLDQIIDFGGDAYKAIQDKDFINLVKSIGGTIKVIDKDFALKTEIQGKTALKDLTGLEWSEFEQLIDASKTLKVAIKMKNISNISTSLAKLTNVWVSDEKLNDSLVKSIGLDWQDLTDVAKTVDVLIPAIRNDDTEAWVKATSDIMTIWDSNTALKKTLQDTIKLEWTELKQLVVISQTTAIAIDQRSINAWVDAIKNILDLALKDTSFDNAKVKQIITTAQQANYTKNWVTAIDQLLGVAKDATALRNKLGEITGVSWNEFKQIINAGQAVATAIDDGKFTNWRDALKTTLNIWVDDPTLQQNIVTTTGLKWEELTRIGSTYEALRKAEQKGDATSWLQAADKVLNLWENNLTFSDKLKTLTSLDWQKLKDLVAIGKTVDTAIDQKSYETWRNALKQTVNFWVDDHTLNKSLDHLIGLNWGQLDKIGLASDALYKTYGKAEQIIDQTLGHNSYKAWLNGIEDIYKLWKDDPILRQKVTDAGNVIWSELDGVLTAQGTLNSKNSQDKIQASIEGTINTLETTLQQKLESTIGLSWTQVKAVAQSGEIIAKAIADNKTDQWIQASDKILSIWEKDSELRQVLKEKYKFDWSYVKASVSSGQILAKAIQANTVPSWGEALQSTINIWAETVALTPQQKDKLQQTNDLVSQVKSSTNSQEWLAVTNQIINLWENESDFQSQLKQNTELSWKDISNSIKSGQTFALKPSGLQGWRDNLKNVVSLWKDDLEIKAIVENISDFNWQSLGKVINGTPVITVAVSPASVTEDSAANLVFTFTRTGFTANDLTVVYAIAGSADSADYTGAAPGTAKTITFEAGSTTASLTIYPTADNIDESDETVTISLAAGTGYTVGTTTAITGTIISDDVESAASFVLGPNQSSLMLTGLSEISGTGNTLGNTIIGNPADNIITGLTGKDTLTGGGTSDRDLFAFVQLNDSMLRDPISGNGSFYDVITDFNSNDRIAAPLSVLPTRLMTSLGTASSIDPTALAALLTTSALSSNSVAAFTVSSHDGTFIAMNDGRAGFQADTDSIVWLRNYSISASNFVEFV